MSIMRGWKGRPMGEFPPPETVEEAKQDWVQITIHANHVGVSSVALDPRESHRLLTIAAEQEVSPAKVLQLALRVFDLYLAGRMRMKPSDSFHPGCGDLE